MAMLGRRFINIVAASMYRPGVLSVHRIDVSEHLFYPSASEALRLVGGDVGDPHRQPMETTETQTELPAPCAVFSDATAAAARRIRSTAAFFSPRNGDGESSKILFTSEAGDSIIYSAADDDEGGRAMPGPGLEDFSGPVAASVSIVGGGAGAKEEESTYVVHGLPDGVALRFHALRFGTPPAPAGGSTRVAGEGRCWYWQSLPPPPFASDDGAVVRSYTVVEGGRTICVSSWSYTGAPATTWCFDTARGEWWHAGDWAMPFEGRVEYLADLHLWLGFSTHPQIIHDDDDSITSAITHADLCTTSGLISLSAAMAKTNKPPKLLQRLWRDHNRKPKQMELFNLGSGGRFAIAKVFKMDDGYSSGYDSSSEDDDDLLVLSGVEIRPRQPPRHSSCDSNIFDGGVELIHHKSISYVLDTHRIHQVL